MGDLAAMLAMVLDPTAGRRDLRPFQRNGDPATARDGDVIGPLEEWCAHCEMKSWERRADHLIECSSCRGPASLCEYHFACETEDAEEERVMSGSTT